MAKVATLKNDLNSIDKQHDYGYLKFGQVNKGISQNYHFFCKIDDAVCYMHKF